MKGTLEVTIKIESKDIINKMNELNQKIEQIKEAFESLNTKNYTVEIDLKMENKE